MRTSIRSRVVGAVLLALALVVGACGDDDGSGGDLKEGPTIKVGSTNFGEQLILGEIYAQVLEANGYSVERQFNLGSREIVNPALKNGEIDLLAEYTGALLTFEGGTATTDSEETHTALQQAIADDGLVALDYAPAQDKDGLVVTAETAGSLGLATISDLAEHDEDLVLGGPPECPDREFCLIGYRDVYGLEFEDFVPLDVGGPLTVAALDGGDIDVGVLFTSDGVIAARNFVLLEDDMNLHPAQNIVPVIRQEILDAYGDELVDLLNRVSAEITTAELSELNKRYGIDAEDADILARDWLIDQGFLSA